MPAGTKLPGQRARSVGSDAALEASGGGSSEDGQGPIECVHTDEVLLPTNNGHGTVAVKHKEPWVFDMAEAALGGQCIGGLIQGPVLMWDASTGCLCPLEMRFDPGDPYKLVPLGDDPLPQVAMLKATKYDSLQELTQTVRDIPAVGQDMYGARGPFEGHEGRHDFSALGALVWSAKSARQARSGAEGDSPPRSVAGVFLVTTTVGSYEHGRSGEHCTGCKLKSLVHLHTPGEGVVSQGDIAGIAQTRRGIS